MTIFRVKPDHRVTNGNIEGLATALYDLGRTWLDRTHRDGWKLHTEPQSCIFVEWHLSHDSADITWSTQCRDSSSVEQHIQTCWPRATVEVADSDPLSEWGHDVAGADVTLREHYMYSLAVDKRALAPLQAILETMRMLHAGERGLLQICLTPAPSDWHIGAQAAYEQLREGRKPKRHKLDSRGITESVARGAAAVALHATALVAEILTGKEIEPEPVDMPSKLVDERRVSHHTMQKGKYPAFDVTIRVAAESSDKGRRQVILRSLGTAFKDMDGDNALVYKPVQDVRKWWNSVTDRVAPSFKVNPDYLSVPEVSRLLQLPSGALQDEYGIASIRHLESDIPESLLSDGIVIGEHTWRGNVETVYNPVDNWDELCLPRVVIGGMGTGKTRGFGGNWGAEALRHGYSVITIDVAKDELGDEIEIGARQHGIDNDHIHRIKFGDTPIRLDWVESSGVRNAANRLAGEAVNFFRLHGAEAGIETGRYIRLAGKTVGTINGTLANMVDLFMDDTYRKSIVSQLKRDDLLQEWKQFDGLSQGMRGKVLDPVLNRLDMLMGDDYLRECLRATQGIDFRQWMTGGHLVALHIPKPILGPEATDILVDFMMAKVEMAMYARPEDEQVPCFVISDEPHQFPSCAPRWERMSVESRKWRVGLVWLFHSFEQIPRSLAHRIKDAGVHYHLYTSSKRTYQELAEEIVPFTVEEAMRTPRHHAINVIRAGGDTVTPFMAKMTPPPSAQ